MTRYVKNPDGAVHSVPDDFELPDDKWEEVSEADASPELIGNETDPQVAAVELHDGPDVVEATTEAPDEPGDKPAGPSNDIAAPNADGGVAPADAAEPAVGEPTTDSQVVPGTPAVTQ